VKFTRSIGARWGLSFLAGLVLLSLWFWLVDGASPLEVLRFFTTASSDVAPPVPFGRVGGVLLVLFVLAWALGLGIVLIQKLLGIGYGPMPVARLVVREATRMRGSVVPIFLLLLVLAIIPATLNTDSPLRYRIQSYLAYSLNVTSLMLGALTVFLGCFAISNEIQEGQARSIFSKPVQRFQYLFGKVLGISVLNALLVAVCGLGMAFVTTTWLARLPALDDYDSNAVREQILTARQVIYPQAPFDLEADAQERLARLQEDNPGWIEERGGVATVYRELLHQVRTEWLSIGPHRQQTYIFSGLQNARDRGEMLQMRFLIEMMPEPPDRILRVVLLANGRQTSLATTIRSAQVVSVPADFIDENGVLELTVVNLDPSDPETLPVASISFPAKDGLQVLFKVDDFLPNLFRSMLLIWVKLVFLAMLSVCAGTFLSFPVACIFALTIWVLAAGSSEILDSLHFTPHEHSHGHETEEQATDFIYERIVVPTMTLMVSGFRKYSYLDVSSRIVDGRNIPWGIVRQYLFWIGLVWSAAIGLIGWLIFRNREIARVQV
jgi:hypothetical protein